jgi:hypothetical protein
VSGTLNIRISRDSVAPATVSVPYTINHLPTLVLVSSANLGSVLELGSSPERQIQFNIADEDADDILTLWFWIDDGQPSLFGTVDRGVSRTFPFPSVFLSARPGIHSIHFEVRDSIDASSPVDLTYAVDAGPVLTIVEPASLTWGLADNLWPLPISFNVAYAGHQTASIECQFEGTPTWFTFVQTVQVGTAVSHTLSFDVLNAQAKAIGTQAVLFRSGRSNS